MSERVHQLNCLQPFFNDVRTGAKTFEVRKNDRDFKLGEKIILYELEAATDHCTGQWFTYIISSVTPATDPGYVALGVSEITDPLKKKADEKALRDSERYSEAQGIN